VKELGNTNYGSTTKYLMCMYNGLCVCAMQA
jgi:hypothetical protein